MEFANAIIAFTGISFLVYGFNSLISKRMVNEFERWGFNKYRKLISVLQILGAIGLILGLKFNRILFDNVSLAQLKKYLKICNGKYETEYSGNANLKNITKISKTGINIISVGSITHSEKSFDSSLLIF